MVAKRQRHLGGGHAVVSRQLVVAAGSGQGLRAGPALLAHRVETGNSATIRHQRTFQVIVVVFAREQTKAQRRVSQQGHVQAVAGFVQRIVIGAVHQAIRVLDRGHPGQAMLLGQAHKLVHAVRRFVRQTDVTHFACFHQFGQGFELFVDGSERFVFGRIEIGHAKHRHMALWPMNLVQVDHIGLQATQAGVTRVQDVLPRHASALAHPGHATRGARHLGRQHQLLARTRIFGKPVANEGLRQAASVSGGRHGVHLGGVDEVDARFERAVQDGMRVGFTHLLTEGHGAQADGGDIQVGLTEWNEFHGVSCVEFKRAGVPRTEKQGDGLILSRVNAPSPAALSRALLLANATPGAALCPWWSWAAGR